MFEENKNLKDSKKDSVKDTFSIHAPFMPVSQNNSVFYTKTDKLISALYMVTDIIEKEEPLRNKLRTLGVEIVSDMHSIQENNIGHLASTIGNKTTQVMSFLEIAYTVNIISEMNYSILRKEFVMLEESLKGSINNNGGLNRKINLVEFLKERETESFSNQDNSIGHHSNGHQYSTRIGVQKGSTLLKALSDKIGRPTSDLHISRMQDFDILKKQRREDIIKIIKNLGGGATIKDIKDKIKTIGQGSPLVTCGEKTLQRELVSMVKDGVLNKTGEKRWSRYFLK